ncbi:zinc-binding dehydrogenase [Porphyromonadaceae bacterium]
MTMKALINFASEPGSVEIRNVEMPEVKPGMVMIRVRAVGVCGSDIHQWSGAVSYPVRYPVTLGHEFAGEVVEVGTGVSDWVSGDRVVCETAAFICGKCVYCRTGNYHHCPKRKGFGALIDGAMAEYIVVREGILHRIPNELSFPEAALCEPACVAYNAVIEKIRVNPGDGVVVIGPGPIGAFCLQMAKLVTPGFLVLIGLSKDRKRMEALDRSIGIDRMIYSDEEDPIAALSTMGDGLGAHAVIDAIGLGITLKQSMALVRPLGKIVKIGWDEKNPISSIDPLIAKGATLQGTFSHTWDMWERVLLLASKKKLDLATVGTCFSMDNWQSGFSKMRELDIIKAVVEP